MSDDIVFSVRGRVGHVLLNRPQAFNALDDDMTVAFHDRLRAWAVDPAVRAVVATSASDRAFCAGGDIRKLWDARAAGVPRLWRYFGNEYRLNAAVANFAKPYCALVDGLALGGGMGIAVNGSHCVVTERAGLAMPETGIGFFPDVGATVFLNRCPGRLGLYLGLTGARAGAADAVYAGLAGAFVPSDRLAALEAALFAPDYGGDAYAAMTAAITAHASHPGPSPLAARQAQIDAAFGAPSMAAILDRLRAMDDPWAAETLASLATKSPTSLAVVFRQLARGAGLDINAAIRMEYRMAARFAVGEEFYEGIRAALVDKDRNPRWNPPRLEDVGDIEAYFAPPPEGELVLG
jgi:enoyl-CoA hydratase